MRRTVLAGPPNERVARGNADPRAPAASEAPLAADGIPLARVIHLLESEAGEPLVHRLMQSVDTYGHWERVDPAPDGAGRCHLEWTARPRDRARSDDLFERAVVNAMDSRPEVLLDPFSRPPMMPAVIADVLASVADERGMLNPGDLPPGMGKDFLQAVEHTLTSGNSVPDRPERPAVHFSYSAPSTQRALLESQPLESFAERMPVLHRFIEKYGGPELLEDWVLGVQAHQFKHTSARNAVLQRCGGSLAFNSGKPYSTPGEVQAKLQHLDGLWGREEPRERRHASNEERMYSGACDRLDDLFQLHGESPEVRFNLFSDGAYLIRALHQEPRFLPYLSRCVAGEQTQSGGNYVEALAAAGKLGVDVGAMWRCLAKKRYESPAIGENVLYCIEEYLAEAGAIPGLDPKQPALIIGGGAVGMACAAALERRGFPRADILIVDKDAAVRAKLHEAGYGTRVPHELLEKAHVRGTPERRRVLGLADTVITATPGPGLQSDEWSQLKDGCKLANAGSGNHGFGCNDVEALEAGEARTDARDLLVGEDGGVYGRFRGKWLKLGDHLALPGEDMRHRLIRTPEGKELFFLRGGYVVNLGRGGLPPEFAQLTHGLILATQLFMSKMARAPEELGPGKGRIVDLPQEMEQDLIRWTQEALAAHGTSLEDPDFRKLERWF